MRVVFPWSTCAITATLRILPGSIAAPSAAAAPTGADAAEVERHRRKREEGEEEKRGECRE